MAETDTRRRGSIRKRGSSLQVRVYAGVDPVTGKDTYLTATVKGTDKAAYKAANKELIKLVASVDAQRAPSSGVRFSYALDEWLRTAELEDSTRHTYRGYIERTIRPALGSLAVKKVSARTLETLYTELRRCRTRCARRPFIEHRADGEHDCKERKCRPHTCKPMAQSTVRQLHAIVSSTLDAAVRWEWIASNPAKIAKRPRQKRPEPAPPSSAEAALLVDEAFRMDDDWGTLVWLAMTTGARRGELCALRFSHIDFVKSTLDISRNFVRGKEKDTKSHQGRRIALDPETVKLLTDHKNRVRERRNGLGLEFTNDLYLFDGTATPMDHSQPYSPNAVTQRYKDMAARLGIETHLHALRHYSATELLTSGVDVRTVAGRLGHTDGTTTLKVYAAWVTAADKKAAEILGRRMPTRSKTD
jgi:integrase